MGFFRRTVVAILMPLLLLPAHGATARNLLHFGRWALIRPAPSDASMETLPPNRSGSASSSSIQIMINRTASPFYLIEISQVILPVIPKGDRIALQFQARSPQGCRMRAVVEHNQPPYQAAGEEDINLASHWKRYRIVAISPGYPANGLGVRFQVGFGKGVVELADIKAEDIGPDPAYAAARSAIQTAAIEARIRKYRMGDLVVAVKGADGKPVSNAVVHFQMTRHAFLFGCNFFLLDPNNRQPWQLEYRRKFVALFNYATLPFYWGSFEPVEGQPNYGWLDAMAKWCVTHGITPKGHPLVWQEVYPSWAPKNPELAIPLLHRRVTNIITHYHGLIHYWDVVNEANNAANYDQTGEGAWVKRDGPARVVATALKWAREAGRGSRETFIYNDFNTGPENVDLLKELQKVHQLPDAIGIQSHMHAGVWPLERVWRVANRFSQFGVPVHFTETTVLSGPYNPGVGGHTTPQGEQDQASYVIKFYTLLFSMPDVRAITWWDFSDRGAWLRAPAGMLRKDMSSKPVYDRLMELIHHTWWTDVKQSSNRGGISKIHAFYGRYNLTVSKDGRQVERKIDFPMGCGEKRITIQLR